METMSSTSSIKCVPFTSSCKNPPYHRVKQFNTSSSSNYSAFPANSFLLHKHPLLFFTLRTNPTIVSVLKTTSVSEQVEDDVVQEFFRDRELNGDLITKFSDLLFQKRVMNLSDTEASEVVNNAQANEETFADEPDGGFLKLTKTQDWLLGETSAPINRKPTNKEIQDDREKRRQLSLLRYEALKTELLFVTLGVGAACTGYCLVILSIQAAISYAFGVGFSYLYLRLLYQHVDNLTRDSIPLIFRQKKAKKIGIRSEDLQDSFEKTVKGSGLALSSPRLVIPAAIYGLWILLHRNMASDIFDFQLVPAMLGLFAYKAAALVQVYRDNEHLELIFPDDI